MVKEYQFAYKFRFDIGHFFLLCWSVFGGAAIGVMGFFISLFWYLVILLPIGIGLLGGHNLTQLSRRWKVTNPKFIVLCTLIFGLSSFFCFHEARYIKFSEDARDVIAQQIGTDDFDMTNQIYQENLIRLTGSSDFWGYRKLLANEGVEIGRFTRSKQLSSGMLVWLYWGLEFFLISGTALFLVWDYTKEPFCEICLTWFQSEQVGRVANTDSSRFMQLLKLGSYREAGKLIELDKPFYPYLTLYLGHCGCAKGESLLTVSQVSEDERKKLHIHDQLRFLLSPQQENDFLDATTDWVT